MRDPLSSALRDLPVFTDGIEQVFDGLIEANGGRIGLSVDPVCGEAIRFTLRYAGFVMTSRQRAPVIGERRGRKEE